VTYELRSVDYANFFIISVPSDFRRGVKEIFAFLGFYAA